MVRLLLCASISTYMTEDDVPSSPNRFTPLIDSTAAFAIPIELHQKGSELRLQWKKGEGRKREKEEGKGRGKRSAFGPLKVREREVSKNFIHSVNVFVHNSEEQ